MAKTRTRKTRRVRVPDPVKALHEILRTSFKNDPKVLPALVLVWALLLCHGVLGFVHQLSSGASADPASHTAHYTHEGSAPSGGVAGGGDAPFGSADYLAVALILFAATRSWWRSARGWRMTGRAAYRRVPTLPRVARLLPRPRAPALQVFRL